MPDMNQLCLTCGYTYGEHSDNGEHCPKNGGSPVNRKFEWFDSCFNAAPTKADQLRATIATLTAANENTNNLLDEQGAHINEQALKIKQLTAHNESMQADARENTVTVQMLMAQLAEQVEENRGMRQMLHMETK